MTRCAKNQVNLKSSAYNQTGQNYFEQLAAYNSMSSHLRRILLARSVVDAKNKNYISTRNQRSKLAGINDDYSRIQSMDDVIDRLAYDTRHHPMDVLKMSLNPKHVDYYDYNTEHRQSRICNSQRCCEENNQKDPRQRSALRNRMATSPTFTDFSKHKKCTTSICRKGLVSAREAPRMIGPAICDQQLRKCRYETDSLLIPCTATTLDGATCKSTARSSTQEDHRSMFSSQNDDADYDNKSIGPFVLKQFSSQKEEEKKYVKFVYDITREIMQGGLYTDAELQDVFKKHIDKNKGILKMNKMLYEIYQLKISLNVLDDSDADDELEDLIHAQKLFSVSEIRPPTPPKVLDDNKVMEKLKSYQKLAENRCRSPNSASKSVVLIDANPELLITERDVLVSLVEGGVNPKQAQHICKNLLHRSRDAVLVETAQVGTETAYTSNPCSKNFKEPQDNDEQISAVETTECGRDFFTDNTADSPQKSEACSSMSNLVFTQEEITEDEKTVESQSMDDDCCEDKSPK